MRDARGRVTGVLTHSLPVPDGPAGAVRAPGRPDARRGHQASAIAVTVMVWLCSSQRADGVSGDSSP